MANVARVEAVITAQDKLRPGLASAARAMETFRRQQSKATPIFAAQKMLDHQAGLLKRAAGIAATYVGAQKVKESVVRFADVDRQMRRAAITGEAGEERIASATAEVRKIAMETATPIQQIQQGFDAMVASGMSFEESLKALPTVAKVASATGGDLTETAKSMSAAMQNMGIQTDKMEYAFDIMAKGGKLGMFESKDMARYLPQLLPRAQTLGLSGHEGLAQIVAMLQTIRLVTGSSEAAGVALDNMFQKMESEETASKFKKMGIDLRKEMEGARKEGKNLLDFFIELSRKAVKGDLSKLPQLFSDMQFGTGMLGALQKRDEYLKFLESAKASQGTIAADYKRVSEDTKASSDRMAESFDRAKTAFGGLVAAMGGKALADRGSASLQAIASHMEASAGVAERDGVIAGVKHLAVDPVTAELKDVGDEASRFDRLFKFSGAADALARVSEEIAGLERGPSGIAARNPAMQQFHGSRLAALRAQYAEMRGALPGVMGAHLLDYSDIKPISTNEIQAEMQRLRESGIYADFEARRARQSGRGREGGAPLPPVRPSDLNGGAAFPVQPLEDAKAKAEEVKQKVTEIGPAGKQAGSELASGIAGGLSSMEAQVSASVDRMQAKLNTLKAPNLSLGGLNTGKSMSEVQ